MTLAIAPSADDPLPRIRLMGTEFAAITEERAVEEIVGAAVRGSGCWAMTANLDHLRRYATDGLARRLIGEADVVVADGMPIVWASRLAGMPLPERVAGSDMIWDLSRRAADAGASLFLLGGEPGTAERAQAVLQRHAPGLTVAGTWCPPFGFERFLSQLADMETALTAAAPDIVVVALGFPKQDVVIERLRRILPQTSFVGIGVSLSFVAGDLSRAPEWMRRAGVEWLHRLAREPGRLWRRYLVHGLPFAARLFASALLARVAPLVDGDWWPTPSTAPRRRDGETVTAAARPRDHVLD